MTEETTTPVETPVEQPKTEQPAVVTETPVVKTQSKWITYGGWIVSVILVGVMIGLNAFGWNLSANNLREATEYTYLVSNQAVTTAYVTIDRAADSALVDSYIVAVKDVAQIVGETSVGEYQTLEEAEKAIQQRIEAYVDSKPAIVREIVNGVVVIVIHDANKYLADIKGNKSVQDYQTVLKYLQHGLVDGLASVDVMSARLAEIAAEIPVPVEVKPCECVAGNKDSCVCVDCKCDSHL